MPYTIKFYYEGEYFFELSRAQQLIISTAKQFKKVQIATEVTRNILRLSQRCNDK